MSFGLPRVPQPPSSQQPTGGIGSRKSSRRGSLNSLGGADDSRDTNGIFGSSAVPAGLLSTSSTTTTGGGGPPPSARNNNNRSLQRKASNVSNAVSDALSSTPRKSTQNGADVLARFRETQNKYENEQNLKQADRLQQRLMWKEQMERSAALEHQITINKKTVINLEKQMEHLKRELASERATFDADLHTKEEKLADAKTVLRSRSQRLENANQELRDCRCAIARMRATLVENFVLDKVYASRPNPDDPFDDVTREDYKFYRIHAAELEHRHRLIVERYVAGNSKVEERIFGAMDSVGGKQQNKKNKKAAKESSEESRGGGGGASTAETAGDGGTSTAAAAGGGGVKKKGPPKALAEVREMLVKLEAEMFEAENGSPASDSLSPPGARSMNSTARPTPAGSLASSTRVRRLNKGAVVQF